MKIKNNLENSTTFSKETPQQDLQVETEFSFHTILKEELAQKKKKSKEWLINQESLPLEEEKGDELLSQNSPCQDDISFEKPLQKIDSQSFPSKKEKVNEDQQSDQPQINHAVNDKSTPVDIILKNITQLIAAFIQKISHTDSIKEQKFNSARYYFKLSQKLGSVPLDISVKKIDGKLAIVLFSTGTLKEDLLTHLDQLTNHLKMQGIQVFSINISELSKEQSSSQHNKRQKQQETVEIGEEDEEEFEEIPI